MNNETGLTFRRINGRIVPIKQKEEYSNIMKGSAKYEFAAAGSVGLGGNILAAYLRNLSAKHLKKAERIYDLRQSQIIKGNRWVVLKKTLSTNNVRKLVTASRHATKLSKAVRLTTFGLTSGFLSAGIQSMLASKIKEPSERTEFALTAGSLIAGTGATFIARKLHINSKIFNLFKKRK